MTPIFDALRDNQHVFLMGGAIWLYFKWQGKQTDIAKRIDEERDAHRKQIEAVIKESLGNGIGQRIRQILAEVIRDHERKEAEHMEKLMTAFRTENTAAHQMIGQRQSTLEERTAVLEDKWASVSAPRRR